MQKNYDILLTEEHKILRQTVRDFVEKEIKPIVDEDDKKHRFQREIVTKMGELGLFGCAIPEEYGGSAMGFLAHAIAVEEIGRGSGSLTAPFNMQGMGLSMQILKHGNEEQKRQYIQPLISAEILGCIGITEPDAGTDVAALKTTAVREGDYYILNGTKTWITMCSVADMGIFYCITDKTKKRKGISAILVDMHSPGITTRDINPKLGWHSVPSGEVIFENVKVPVTNLLGAEGTGFKCVLGGLNNTRLTAAARAIGLSEAIIEESIKYAHQRIQFGQEIGQFQMVKEQVARMVIENEAARLLVYRCAAEKDMGIENPIQTAMAKYYACDVVSRNSDVGLLIFGAYGYSAEYPMERLLRDAKAYSLIEGSPNVLKNMIANNAMGY